MRLIRWTFSFLLAAAIAAFAVANRQNVEIFWSPVNPSITLPLYMITLGLLAVGFLAGGFVVWINTIPLRYSAHKQKRKIKNLEGELAKEQALEIHAVNENGMAETPPAARLPFFSRKANVPE